MKKAMLVYEDYNDSKAITLETNGLNAIDTYTKYYTDINELKRSYKYELKAKNTTLDVDNSDIKLFCIKDADTREQLPLLLNDETEIELYDNMFNNTRSQVETSRKLIFNSKDRMYLKTLLDNESLSKTMLFTVNISYSEYQYLTKKNISVIMEDGKYYVLALNVLKYVSQDEKLGPVRGLFEDTLDIWKRRIANLDIDNLYYYSRNLRILQNDYYKYIKTHAYEAIDEKGKVKKIA